MIQAVGICSSVIWNMRKATNCMKKILWLSNFCFCEEANTGSGTWIESMGKALVQSGKYDLCNITLGPVNEPVQINACGIRQWVFPIKAVARKALWELPHEKILRAICRVANDIKPDLVHVWGIERFWGLLTARKLIDYPALLEMQGIPSAMAPYMTGCLEQSDLRKCFRLKEVLRPSLSLPDQQKRFRAAAQAEREIIRGHRFIDYQSEWIRSYVEPVQNGATMFKTRMILREEFLRCDAWRYRSNNHVVFASCGWAANKGVHVLIEACRMLQGRFPDIQLRVAGGFSSGIRRSGYQKFAMDMAKGLDVVRLGGLSPNQMIEEMHNAAVYVNPSLVESYSMSLAEAMAVGCPCVATYAGAMPEVGGDACLYFPIVDAGALQGCIAKVFEMKDGVRSMSEKAREKSMADHDQTKAVERQIEIYESVLKNI